MAIIKVMELRIPKELHRKAFDLTLALYRVTDFFPQGEALRRHLREKADDIFGMVAEYGYSQECEREAALILAKTQSVKGYLALARSLRFVKPINLSVLEREYSILADFFTRELEQLKQEAIQGFEERNHIQRQNKFELDGQDDTDPAVAEVGKEEKRGLDSLYKKRPVPVSASDQRNILSLEKGGLNQRQKQILEYLSKESSAKISSFFASFQSVSSKTIQRDLQDLVAKNILKKEGEKRWTTYSLGERQLENVR